MQSDASVAHVALSGGGQSDESVAQVALAGGGQRDASVAQVLTTGGGVQREGLVRHVGTSIILIQPAIPGVLLQFGMILSTY